MTFPFPRKRVLVALGLVLLLLIGYSGIGFYYTVSVYLKATAAVSEINDVREACFKFRQTHHRWPHTMQEVYGIQINEGIINEKHCKDPISGYPFCCIADKQLYYRIGTERPYRVLVCFVSTDMAQSLG